MANNYQYGGQAVIEGVMMRGRSHYSIAVRKDNDEMSVRTEKLGSYTQKNPVLRFPFIRGVIALGESFILGLKALQYSANQFMDTEGEEELSFWEMALMILFALGFTVLLFIVLPLFIRGLVGKVLPGIFWRNLTEGLIRALILVLYITAVSFVCGDCKFNCLFFSGRTDDCDAVVISNSSVASSSRNIL